MFSSILFFILLILIVQFSPETASLFSPFESFLAGLVGYSVLLLLIRKQHHFLALKMRFSLERRLFITNVELLFFLFGYHFFLGAQHLYTQGPFAILWCLLGAFFLYFGGLAVFYRASHKPLWAPLSFLLPFAIPALLLSFLDGLFSFLPPLPYLQEIIYGFVLLGLLILFPPLMVKCWGCSQLPEGAERDQLEALCERAKFKYAGLCTWPVMAGFSTAAIVGVTARFRYILFTKSLLERHEMSEVEAVLAHEIGHSQRKHLLLYPLVFSGVLVLSTLLYKFVGENFSSAVLFILYGMVVVLYYRFIFGYFSRLFERQADLHGFVLGVPPQAMIRALDRVAIHAGLIHDQPNWHHHSIRARIDFLEGCEKDPKQIERHHRRVKYALGVYFFLLALSILCLFIF